MARRAQPYTAVGPQQGNAIAPVGVAPTLATRSRYGNQAMIGLVTQGTKRGYVPIQHPWPGQGAIFPAFPHVTGSSVAPDSIRPALLVARNLYSPAGHSNPLTHFVPPQAVSPMIWRRPPQTQSGRPSGTYSLGFPAPAFQWPTSSEWLANRMRTSQGQPPSGWASSRVQSR